MSARAHGLKCRPEHTGSNVGQSTRAQMSARAQGLKCRPEHTGSLRREVANLGPFAHIRSSSICSLHRLVSTSCLLSPICVQTPSCLWLLYRRLAAYDRPTYEHSLRRKPTVAYLCTDAYLQSPYRLPKYLRLPDNPPPSHFLPTHFYTDFSYKRLSYQRTSYRRINQRD